MLGFRMAFGVVGAALFSCATSGCGGTVEHRDPSEQPGGAGQGGSEGSGASTSGGTNVGRAGSAGAGTGASSSAGRPTTEPEPVDTGCPEQPPLPPDLTCDPFVAQSCGPGLGCYPFVEHPEGNGCGQQRYGTVCAPAGSGVQGQACGGEAGGCAPGFVCVIGQRAGKRCTALCQLGKPNTCTGGLLCADLDVAGFGACG